MNWFSGDFDHSVDAKGRIIVPSVFREGLGDQFKITKSFDGCLSIYDMKCWDDVMLKLVQMPTFTEDARDIRRIIAGGAATLECDKMGRVLIPASLREYAGIDKDAVFVGNIDHVELWSREAWDRKRNLSPNASAEKLYNSGIRL